ncbi:hypothetical protein GCM10007052_28750 [Halioglobus japonicus]|uniref:sulfotransferase family protein n=1 Tax=Halioglobus japonicus TaxID=930805 RepID=UPI0019B9EDE3|nr:sulfotransferase family protein [Halioglobus japonicus]GHD19813.1 hypothetical protein GCM10007052_28750 [Halioglobus japonicus]
MNLLTNLLWRLMPAKEREMLLAYAPQYQQRHIERILKGRATYQPCFDEHQALFIHVPKSAGRSVVRGMFDIKSVEHAPADWYQLLDPDKYRRYFKFTFVRNPWDRAVSAYTYLQQGGSAASSDDSLWSEFVGNFASFDEFVTQWMTPENVMRNALFTPQIVFLTNRFGQMDMDYVGRFENLHSDFSAIAQKLGVERELPHLNQSRSQPYQTFYSEASRQRVAEVYRQDIEAFGYSFD